MERFQQSLKESIKHLQIADHMAYVTFPLVNDRRLLLKIFEEIYKSIIFSIDTAVDIEKLEKKEINEDFVIAFLNKYSNKYNLSNEKINKISEIMELNKKHKKSAMEFVRKDKIIIMSNNLGIHALNINDIKDYLSLAKEIIMKINKKFKEKEGDSISLNI